jgi:hypothetical protein
MIWLPVACFLTAFVAGYLAKEGNFLGAGLGLSAYVALALAIRLSEASRRGAERGRGGQGL